MTTNEPTLREQLEEWRARPRDVVPTGTRPPSPITSREGDLVEIAWQEVIEDVDGRPTAVVSHREHAVLAHYRKEP